MQTGKSIRTLAIEYNFLSNSTIHKWIIKYIERKENKIYSPKPRYIK
ncbi:hypothetical protein [Macrococcus animalis]